jgi:hypothetical protein
VGHHTFGRQISKNWWLPVPANGKLSRMPFHIHTPPQCGFWTGHDPACFDEQFGAEIDCILIELGKNKGKYVCIHARAPITDRGRGGFLSDAGASASHERRDLDATLYAEYAAIRAELTEGVERLPAVAPVPPPRL